MSRCHTLTPALAPDLPPPVGLDDTITPAQAVSRVSYASIHAALTTQLTLAAQTLSETIQTLHACRAHFTDRIYQPPLLPDDPTPELDTYPAPATTAMIATLILLAALTLLH